MAKLHPISGTYRITHMDEWDQEFVDGEVPGYIRFDPDGDGEFQFGGVHGLLDGEETERDGKPAIEFTWEGSNDADPACGRGWIVGQEDGTLLGKLFIHTSDSSGFTAEKNAKGKEKGEAAPKVRVIDVTTGKTVEIEVEKLRPGRVQHADLPEPLLRRIRAIHEAVNGLVGSTLEQMELNFMRDSHPEKEVAHWERIVAGMERVHRKMPELDRKVILKTLLAYSLSALTPAELVNAQVKKIIRMAEGK